MGRKPPASPRAADPKARRPPRGGRGFESHKHHSRSRFDNDAQVGACDIEWPVRHRALCRRATPELQIDRFGLLALAANWPLEVVAAVDHAVRFEAELGGDGQRADVAGVDQQRCRAIRGRALEISDK